MSKTDVHCQKQRSSALREHEVASKKKDGSLDLTGQLDRSTARWADYLVCAVIIAKPEE